MRVQIALAGLASILCASAGAAPPTRYAVTGATITDLGTLGGSQSTALDINDYGEIVGWAEVTTGRRHAFLYRGGFMDDISGFTGASYDSEATGINRWTRVVGSFRHPSLPNNPQAFRWEAGVLRLLNDYYSADCDSWEGSEAFAISDSDYIAGRILCGGYGGYYEAARWHALGSAYVLLDHFSPSHYRAPPFIWNNVAYDINTAGTAVGRTKDVEQMVRWGISPAPARSWVPSPPGFYDAGWPDDGANAINDAGAVVGKVRRSSDGAWRAFLWTGTGASAIELGALPGGFNSYGYDLNEQRFVAGSADVSVPVGSFYLLHRVAFAYHPDFGLFALPVLSTTGLGNCEAQAINERNTQTRQVQLVGYCDSSSGKRAVRWDVTVSVVPTSPPGTTP